MRSRPGARPGKRWVCVVLVAIFTTAPCLAQQSSTFTMDRVEVVDTAGHASGPTFDAWVVVAGVAPVGAASTCNTGFTASLGLDALSGHLPVPIRLELERSQAAPDQLALTWTGNAPAFRVYRSDSPQSVIDPANLLQISQTCGASPIADPHPISFYRIVEEPEP